MAAGTYARRAAEAAPRAIGARQRVRRRVRGAALSAIARLRPGRRENVLRCLYCHYVFDDQVERFGTLIDALRRVGTFVDTATALDMATGRVPVERQSFHLSFDDGFLNHATNAAPVLRDRHVPALFFVPTGLLGADWEASRRYSLETTMYPGVIELMDWSDAERLRQWGFDVGSHTRTHARLSSVSGQQLEEEVMGSKAELERRLGACRYISWPYGRRSDVSGAALTAIRSAGYEACFGAFRGVIRPAVTDLYQLPRHHFEVDWPISHTVLFASGFGEGGG